MAPFYVIPMDFNLFFFRNIHTECWGIGTDIPSLEHDFVLEPSTHNCSCSAPAEFQAREFAWRRISLSRLMGIYYFFNVHQYKLHRNSSQLVLHSAFSLLTKKKQIVANCSIFFSYLDIIFLQVFLLIIFFFLLSPRDTQTNSWSNLPHYDSFPDLLKEMKCQKPHFELHSTGRNLGENGNSTALPRDLDKETGKLFGWFGGFFCLIFTEFFNLNTPWLPWLLQGGPFLLAGDSGSAGRLAPAFPWLFEPCCPSHPCRDLTFPQQLCHSHNN